MRRSTVRSRYVLLLAMLLTLLSRNTTAKVFVIFLNDLFNYENSYATTKTCEGIEDIIIQLRIRVGKPCLVIAR